MKLFFAVALLFFTGCAVTAPPSQWVNPYSSMAGNTYQGYDTVSIELHTDTIRIK